MSLKCMRNLLKKVCVLQKSVCVEQKLMFRARLPSIFVTSHKMPRLRNLHLVLTMRFANTRNTTRLKGCTCHAKWRWTRPKCRACQENWNSSFQNDAKVLRLPHKAIFDTLQNIKKCHTCHAKQSNATFETSKVTPFAELTIGTATRASRGRPRTVADGCEHKRNVERTHPQPPDPQSETGTLALATHSGRSLAPRLFTATAQSYGQLSRILDFSFGLTAWMCTTGFETNFVPHLSSIPYLVSAYFFFSGSSGGPSRLYMALYKMFMHVFVML